MTDEECEAEDHGVDEADDGHREQHPHRQRGDEQQREEPMLVGVTPYRRPRATCIRCQRVHDGPPRLLD
ncbi:MAG TPA: hypothetical protein DCY89_05840 [Gammaproteobacteria bacterium]|nr:hypothetical protein [Gammaproteobacteria bacterium]